jgi:hypothetical protein
VAAIGNRLGLPREPTSEPIPHHDDQVDHREGGGEQPVGERAREQQVDVVQAVPEDRDADGGVHGREQHGRDDRVQ